MMTLIFAVLLAIAQATPPIPRQTSNSAAGAGDSIKKQAKSDSYTSSGASVPVNDVKTTVQANEGGNQPSYPNADQAIRVRELPAVSVSRDWMDITGWMFGGILVIVSIVGTIAAFKNLAKIEEQINDARKSSVAATAIAKTTAEAAQASAQAIINSERPWMFLEIKRLGDFGSNTFEMIFTNQGKTPAEIVSVQYHLNPRKSTDDFPPAPS